MPLRILLVSFVLLVSACSGGPRVTVCVVDAPNGNMQCHSSEGESSVLPIIQADKYVCMSPSDMERLLEWAKKKCDLE